MTELSPNMYDAVLRNIPNMIIVVDRDGIIQYMNHTLGNVPVEAIVGNSQYDFVPPQYGELLRKVHQDVFSTGKASRFEVEGGVPGREARTYATLACPIERDGEVVAASFFTIDVTEQKTTEDELQKAKDELIAQQSRAIQELSTPVIEVAEDILVLPLIGAIDTARAQRIVESLLETIVDKQASVVIMDITGVPVIDTAVANHLITTVSAVAILGTRMILTGVSPHNAQTLVKLGVDLGAITTKSSLRAGLQHAFQLTGRRLVNEA